MFKDFPRLNGLKKITMESTALKLMEEAGELSQAIAKFRGINGEEVVHSEKEIAEKISSELLDVMQVCASMAYVLEDEYEINMNELIDEHIQKMRDKGYLEEE